MRVRIEPKGAVDPRIGWSACRAELLMRWLRRGSRRCSGTGAKGPWSGGWRVALLVVCSQLCSADVVLSIVKSAVKTGLTMECSTLAAAIIALIFTQSDVIREIMTIIFIGLLADIFFTWIQRLHFMLAYFTQYSFYLGSSGKFVDRSPRSRHSGACRNPGAVQARQAHLTFKPYPQKILTSISVTQRGRLLIRFCTILNSYRNCRVNYQNITYH